MGRTAGVAIATGFNAVGDFTGDVTDSWFGEE
jgi:hypothetical protein